MSEGSRPLPGVRGISYSLVDRLVPRSADGGRRLPVVAALGPRGSGKTALLNEIGKRCVNRVPWALLDFEELGDARPSKILTELAFDLSREVTQFGRLAFPRLWLCALVLAGNVNTGNRPKALAELNEVMRADRPLELHREQVLDLARLAGETGGLPGWAPTATSTLLNGLNWVSRRRMLRLIRRLSSDFDGDARDLLVDLNKKDRGSSADRAAVDATVFDAFLADLDQAFSGPLRRMRRTANCVLLLDNAHTREGKSFLAGLLAARERFGGDDDHAVVITTSRTWNAGWNGSWRRPGTDAVGDRETSPPRDPAEVEVDSRTRTDWGDWYLVLLGRLAAADTEEVVTRRGAVMPKGFAHRLTHGRPGALHDLVDAVSQQDVPPTGNALRAVLSLPGDEESGKSLAELALGKVGRDLSDRQVRDLVTASAGRGIEFIADPVVLRSDLPDGGGSLYTFLATNFLLTVEHDEDENPRSALDPWLRKLLLHVLAERADDDPLGWNAVNLRCRDHHEALGNVAEARYHDLAVGDVGAVVTHLAAPFVDPAKVLDQATALTWLRDLDLITSAPNRLARAVDPLGQVEDLVRDLPADSPTLVLSRLVIALWLTSDPLGDPEGVLRGRVEHGYSHLAQQRGQGSILLYDRAERYRA
ncbi:hypothetical protein ACFFQW_15270 [Umezawaea endophytica]|uniref:Uncharacterized protein n=1 Tax=Umezawaea endophytica TaxID=1654476 RepID=A0A9X2ZZ21_9PSEU|nr:hypothetical protein [Umezawaea endophytica]MCS7475468.1 hypothetical protein [Umezawaea endophytica]